MTHSTHSRPSPRHARIALGVLGAAYFALAFLRWSMFVLAFREFGSPVLGGLFWTGGLTLLFGTSLLLLVRDRRLGMYLVVAAYALAAGLLAYDVVQRHCDIFIMQECAQGHLHHRCEWITWPV